MAPQTKAFANRIMVAVVWLGLQAGVIAGDAPRWQGTAADYQRSDKLGELTRNKVFKANVQPVWFAENTRFWYRNDLANGVREFVLVDTVKGTREPAFDSVRLSSALNKLFGTSLAPAQLPFTQIAFDDKMNVLFNVNGKNCSCDPKTYEIHETAKPVPTAAVRSIAAPHPSSHTGIETHITFVNQAKMEADLYWMDTEGKRQRYATLKAGEQYEQQTFEGHVWLVAARDGKTLGVYEATENPSIAIVDNTPVRKQPEPKPVIQTHHSRTSPDGKWEVIWKDQNLWLRNTANKESAALTTDGKPGDDYNPDAFWSADSAHFVALKTKAGQEHKVYLVQSSPPDQLQPKLKAIDYLKPGDRIPITKPHLFDTASRKEIPVSDALFPNPWEVSEFRWQPDSSRFTFLYNQRGHQVLRIIGIDAHSGTAEAIVDEQSKTFIDYAGKKYSAYLEATNEIIWMSERDGWNHLYLYDAKTGQVKNQITRGQWVVRHVDRIDEQKRQIWFRAIGIYTQQDPYYIHYCRVNFDGSSLTRLTEGDGTHSIEYSPDEKFIIDKYSRVDLPPVTELRRVEDGNLVCALEKADASALFATGWQAPEPFVAKGRDGVTDIYGVIVRPMNFDPSHHFPVIENIYAGPQDSYVPKAWSSHLSMQNIAELGFVMVMIDGMGTSNRSKAFHDVCWKNLGDAGFPDRIQWMQAAAKKYPYMDLTRVGIYGGSAGGQNALRAMLAFGDFYKAAVADCGCHDNRMDKIWWNELWMGWPVGPQYEAQSNVTNAKNLKGKLFLTVGEMDDNVDPSSTMQVVNALIKADKDFEFLITPNGKHGSGESPYGQRRRKDFFVRHLIGVEPRKEL